MAYTFQYSKIFTQNGAPVAPVTFGTDRLVMSIPAPVSSNTPNGYMSMNRSLYELHRYTVTQFARHGFGYLAKSGGGITGDGTINIPLIVDKRWMNDRYMPSLNFPISQVGDPTDFILPISGSYFSVSFPYSDAPYPPTAYSEGNGDLRMLHHVTNGEDLRPVYALWKNYRNTPISSMLLTDVVYRPPGLAPDEFIHNVFHASETAMMAELWRAEGFVEHVIIELNGTLVATYHKVIRLGKQLFQALWDVDFTYNNMAYSRTGLSVVKKDDKYYIGCATGIFATPVVEAYSGCLMATVTVGSNGVATVVPIMAGRATSVSGKVYQRTGSQKGFIFHTKPVSQNASDLDGMYVFGPGITYSDSGQPYGRTPSNFLTFVGLAEDGRIMMTMRHYHACISPAGSRDLKPIFYYLFDPDTKSIEPMAWNAGKRWTGVVNPANGGIDFTGRNLAYQEGHYWAYGSTFQVLNDGTRVVQTVPGGLDINHAIITIVPGEATTAEQGCNDSSFIDYTQTVSSRSYDPITPTPTLPGKNAYCLYNTFVTTQYAPSATGLWADHVRNRLIGPQAAKQYRLLQPGYGSAPIIYYGYALNNDRTRLITMHGTPFVTVINNTPYYHTGFFCRGQDHSRRSGRYGLNESLENQGEYYMNPDLYGQIDQALAAVKAVVADYPNDGNLQWTIVAPYPKVGKQRAILKYQKSFYREVPIEEEVHGRFWHDTIQACVIDCNVVMEPDGTARLDSLDLASINKVPLNYGFGAFYSNSDASLGWMGGVTIENPDGTWVCAWRGGGNQSSYYDGNFAGWKPMAIVVEANNALRGPLSTINYWGKTQGIDYDSSTISVPTWHPVHGLGIINSGLGLGTFYAFQKINPANGWQILNEDLIVLGSARPAAGFSITVSSKIAVYTEGVLKYIEDQIIDLRDTKADARWTTFHIWARALPTDTNASLVVSLTPVVDDAYNIYIGKIVTNETEISEMTLEPVSRWQTKRTSTEARGSAILVSTGFPGEAGHVSAISAGIDPTRSNGNVVFSATANELTVTNGGSFYVVDKALAISRFGMFLQTYAESAEGSMGYINGIATWNGALGGSTSVQVNLNNIIVEGWNSVSIPNGKIIIQGPFLKR